MLFSPRRNFVRVQRAKVIVQSSAGRMFLDENESIDVNGADRDDVLVLQPRQKI